MYLRKAAVWEPMLHQCGSGQRNSPCGRHGRDIEDELFVDVERFRITNFFWVTKFRQNASEFPKTRVARDGNDFVARSV